MSAVPDPGLPLTFTTVIQGRSLTYGVIVSRRARSWRLSIQPGAGLTVVLPAKPAIDVADVLRTKAAWIFRWMDHLGRRPAPARVPVSDGCRLPYVGGTLRLALAPSRSDTRLDETGTLYTPPADARRLKARLETWYRDQARDFLPQRVALINAGLGYRFNTITIRDQKTRWGSCSARGNLAFNWRLMMAPLDIVDSVVAHELVHLVDLSHRRSFWRRLSAVDPDYEAHRRWLKEHGSSLGFETP